METMNFLEKLKEYTENQDVLGVAKEVSELRSKFDDFLLEEERKVQVAELEAQEQHTEVDQKWIEKKEELLRLKDAFYDLYQTYRARKKDAVDAQNALEAKNLSEKRALIHQLREVVNKEENIGAAFAALSDIQEKWKAIGAISRNKRNEIETEYGQLLDDFYYNIKIYKELKDHDFHRNAQLKNDLIESLKKLNQEESIKEVENQLKQLQNDWNDIGPVPNEDWEVLKEKYWTEVRSLYNKINRFYDDRRTEMQENLKKKEALLEELKTFVEENSTAETAKLWDQATQRVLEIQNKWKTIGFGPKKENDAIYKSFRSACDVFFEAKKSFFATVHEQFDAIAEKKKQLIEKAHNLKESTDWKSTSAQLKQLQQQWKKIGHSGVKHEQKLWKEFRKACDHFFSARDAHFGSLDKENEENLTKKQALIQSIETFVPGEDKKEALAQLQKFAHEFNAIGHVPLKEKDAVYKSFKNAMDQQYEALDLKGSEKEKVLFQAKIETLKASPNAHRMLNETRTEIRKEIEKLKKEITLLENNLGFFANSKGADALKKDVEKKVDAAKSNIEQLKQKLKQIPNE